MAWDSGNILFSILLAFATVTVVQCSLKDDCDADTSVDITRCNLATLNCCKADLKKYDTGKTDAMVPILNEVEARQHCRLYDQFEMCMEPSSDNCTHTDRLLFEGIEASYDYWCLETFEEYLEHQPCFNNADLHAEGDNCALYFDHSIASIDKSLGLAEFYRKRCHFVENYLDCVFNAVKHRCGLAAARWEAGFDARSLKPLLDASGCLVLIDDQSTRGDDDNNKTIMIALVAALGVVFIIICILVAVAIYWRRKPKRPRESEPPPPYMGGAGAAGAEPYVVYDPVTGAQVGGFGEAGPLPYKEPPPGYTNSAYSGDRNGQAYSQGGRSDRGSRPSRSQGGRSDGRSIGSSGNSRRPSDSRTTASSNPAFNPDYTHLSKQQEMAYNNRY